MNIDRMVLGFAGLFILASVVLSQLHHPYWLWFTAFVGVNLLQASVTRFCPLARILALFGGRKGEVFS